MLIHTQYGEYLISETATGLMAEHTSTHVQLFLEDWGIPNPEYTHDMNRLINQVESEYEFQHDLNK